MAGHKRIENRTWATKYRGPLWIHAGKSRAWLAQGLEFLSDRGIVPATTPGADASGSPVLVYGALIGLVELVDCLPPAECGGDPFAFGPWCWVLRDARTLDEPIPCKGAQKLFRIE